MNLKYNLYKQPLSVRLFFLIGVLFMLFSTSCNGQNEDKRINEILEAFENIMKQAPSDELNKAFVNTYEQPSEERKFAHYRYIKQCRQELDGANMGTAIVSGKYERTYNVSNAAVGSGDIIIIMKFLEKAPYNLISLGFTILLASNDEAVKDGMKQEEIVEVYERKLNEWVEKDEFSGAVLVAKDGKAIFKKAYGMASKSFEVPNKIDTKFNIASITKVFTSVSIAQLVEEGKLSFTDRIIDILPDYPNKEVAQKVTIHHLLTHTSGLKRTIKNDKYYAYVPTFRDLSDHLEYFGDNDLQFEPGAKFAYSNEGYIILGLIIEKISGASYFDYVKAKIFKPVGMINTDFYEIDFPIKNLAVGYTQSDHLGWKDLSGPRRNNWFQYQGAKGTSAGGAYSTVEDLLRFMNHLQSNKLISEKMKKELFIERSSMFKDPKYDTKYGYGITVFKDNGSIAYGHGGGSKGVSTGIKFFPEQGYSYVILANYDNTTVGPVLTEMIFKAEKKSKKFK